MAHKWSCAELPIFFSKRSTSPQLWPSPPWCWLRGIESTWNSAEGAQLGIHKWKHLIFSWHFNSRNRDAEAKLMANEEGWEVGTWYGHPIYKVSSYSLMHFYAHELGTDTLCTRYRVVFFTGGSVKKHPVLNQYLCDNVWSRSLKPFFHLGISDHWGQVDRCYFWWILRSLRQVRFVIMCCWGWS